MSILWTTACFDFPKSVDPRPRPVKDCIDYFIHGLRLLQEPIDLVVYTNRPDATQVAIQMAQKRTGHRLVQVVRLDLDALPWMRYLDVAREIQNEAPNAKDTAPYILLTYCKLWFVADTVMHYDPEIAGWVDFGIAHVLDARADDNGPFGLAKLNGCRPARIAMSNCGPISGSRAMSLRELIELNRGKINGGLMFGPGREMRDFERSFDFMVLEALCEGMLPIDEWIYTAMMVRHPERFQRYFSKGYDLWNHAYEAMKGDPSCLTTTT